MKKGFYLTGVLAVSVLLFLTGCSTPAGMSRLVVTEKNQVNQKWPLPRDSFNVAEVPFVRVIDCDGNQVTLKLINAGTGAILATWNGQVPEHTIKVEPEQIVQVHYGLPNGPVIPVRQTKIDIYGKRILMPLMGLSPGS